MTKEEIIDKGISGLGLVRVQGKSSAPLIPFLLADYMYQCYNSALSKFKPTGRLKQMTKVWRHKYDLFNRPFFSQFTEDEYSEVTDLMDDFAEFIGNETMVLRSKIMLSMKDVDFKDKEVITGLCMASVFARFANCAYMQIVQTPQHNFLGALELKSVSNEILNFLTNWSWSMASEYCKLIKKGVWYIDEWQALQYYEIIANKIIKWIDEK